MQLSGAALERYVEDVAAFLERFGAQFADDLEVRVRELRDGSRWFELRSLLASTEPGSASRIAVRERWGRTGTTFVREGYEYELVDVERGFRRAFHLHDRDWFIDRLQVVVHEHCERPIGVAPCPHVEGSPVRDAFQAIERLLVVWVYPDPPDCGALRCLAMGDR